MEDAIPEGVGEGGIQIRGQGHHRIHEREEYAVQLLIEAQLKVHICAPAMRSGYGLAVGALAREQADEVGLVVMGVQDVDVVFQDKAT